MRVATFLPLFLLLSAVLATPLTAASPTLTANVQTDKSSYYIGENIIVYGSILSDGAPLHNVTVALEIHDPVASPVITRSLQTNSSGIYSVTFKLQQDALAGSYNVFVSCTYDGETAFSSASFQVRQASNLVVTVATDKQSYVVGDNVTIRGNVTFNSIKLSQALVAVEVQNPNSATIIVRVLESDGQGTYNLTFQIPTGSLLGSYTVFVSVSHGESNATAETSFALKPQTSSADINGDGVVNILDLVLVALAWGSSPGDPRWDARCDLDGSGLINIIDIYVVAREFRVSG